MSSRHLFPKTSVTKWTEEELKLIEAVKNRPFLYNGSRRKIKNSEAWDEIGLEIGMSGVLCIKKWHSLRKTYKLSFLSGHSIRKSNSKFADGTLNFLNPYIILSKKSKSFNNSHKHAGTYDIEENEGNAPNIILQNNPSAMMRIEPQQELSNVNTPNTTVLTQDIIEYLLKSKTDNIPKENDDIFESIANLVPDTTTAPSSSSILSTVAIQPNILPYNPAYENYELIDLHVPPLNETSKDQGEHTIEASNIDDYYYNIII